MCARLRGVLSGGGARMWPQSVRHSVGSLHPDTATCRSRLPTPPLPSALPPPSRYSDLFLLLLSCDHAWADAPGAGAGGPTGGSDARGGGRKRVVQKGAAGRQGRRRLLCRLLRLEEVDPMQLAALFQALPPGPATPVLGPGGSRGGTRPQALGLCCRACWPMITAFYSRRGCAPWR